MHYIDFCLFENKLNFLEEYNEERAKEEDIKRENLFNSVIFERNSIDQCEDLSIDDLFLLLENSSNIVSGYNLNSETKTTIINNTIKKRRQRIRRLI